MAHVTETAPEREVVASTNTTTGRDPKWWTLVAVCLGVFILLLDITIVNVALADIQGELHASLSDLQWVIDAYALSLAALLLTAGSLADLYGRRLVFVIGTALFMVGSIACGAAQDIFFLQLARAFQGIGGAAMFATALALIASAFQGRDRGVAFGAFGATTGVAVAVGPVLGGVLTSGISWRWIFFVNIPICLLAIAIADARSRESHDPRAGRPDWLGFVTFSLALGSLVYGLIRAGQTEWSNGRVVFCLVAAAVLLVVFVVSQLVRGEPDVRPRAAPQADLHRRAGRGVRDLRLGLLAAHLPGHLRPERPRLLRRRGRRPVPVPLGAAFVSRRWPAGSPRRCRPSGSSRRASLVVGVGLLLIHGIEVDSSWTHLIPGLAVAASVSDGQHAAGLDRGRRGLGRALGHGLRHQLDAPPGRHRHRHRGARHDLRPPGRRRHPRRPGRYSRGGTRAPASS